MVCLPITFNVLLFHSRSLPCYLKVNSPTTVYNTEHMPFVHNTRQENIIVLNLLLRGLSQLHTKLYKHCYMCIYVHTSSKVFIALFAWSVQLFVPPSAQCNTSLSVFISNAAVKWSQILIGSVWLWHLLPYWLSLRIDVFPLMKQELMSRLYNGPRHLAFLPQHI